MPNLGPMEILVVLVVALVVLGPKRLPEAGRQVGKAMAEMRKWTSTVQNEVKSVMDFDEEAPPPKSWNPDATTPATLAAASDPPPVGAPGDPTSMSPDLPPPPPIEASSEAIPAGSSEAIPAASPEVIPEPSPAAIPAEPQAATPGPIAEATLEADKPAPAE